MKVGIWGYGFVGQAQHHIIHSDVNITIYDFAEKYCDNQSRLLDTDLIFICLPTPEHVSGAQDASIVTLALQYLYNKKYQGTVVVKSTTLWSNLTPYEEILNLCYNPEFLNQNSSFEDAETQNTIILGGRPDTVKSVAQFYREYTSLIADFEYMTIKEASDFKYTRNMYSAYKALFWEFIQDTTGNARKMGSLYSKIPLKDVYSVGMDGYRGYGGACLPKDVNAWNADHQHELTKFMIEFNKKLQE